MRSERRPAPRTSGARRPAEPVFPVEHPYVDLLYTPAIGPSAAILVPRLVKLAECGRSVPIQELAIVAGLRAGSDAEIGARSPLANAVRRLERFGLVTWNGDDELVVAETVRPRPEQAVAKLPLWLQRLHAEYLSERVAEAS